MTTRGFEDDLSNLGHDAYKARAIPAELQKLISDLMALPAMDKGCGAKGRAFLG